VKRLLLVITDDAASQSAANEFSTALLARGSLSNQDQLNISVAISKVGM